MSLAWVRCGHCGGAAGHPGTDGGWVMCPGCGGVGGYLAPRVALAADTQRVSPRAPEQPKPHDDAAHEDQAAAPEAPPRLADTLQELLALACVSLALDAALGGLRWLGKRERQLREWASSFRHVWKMQCDSVAHEVSES